MYVTDARHVNSQDACKEQNKSMSISNIIWGYGHVVILLRTDMKILWVSAMSISRVLKTTPTPFISQTLSPPIHDL